MTTFTDDFNRADSTSLGAGWVEVSGDWSIISNQLSSGSAGGTIILRAAGAMATNDNSAQVTVAVTAAVSHGVWCRGNSNISSGYLWRNDGSSWNLFSVVGGSFTSIGSYAAAAVAGDVAKVQAAGSTIKGFVNGVQRVSVTDTNVVTGTSVGIRAESVAALRFDDFTGADVATGSTGDAASSVAATLSASGLRAATGSAALMATASLTAGGTVATVGDTALTVTANLAAAGLRAASGDAAITATATLSAAGQYGATATVDLAATAALATTGLVDHPGQGALASTAALAASGVRDTHADTDLAVTAALTGQGQVARDGVTALTVTVTFAADGTTGVPPALGGAALNAAGILAAAGHRAAVAGTALAAAAPLTAGGTIAATASAALAATATLTAGGTTLSTHDDIDITVGAPYSPWAAGEPHASAWSVQTPQAINWEVGAPC